MPAFVTGMMQLSTIRLSDPRFYQIGVLTCLVTFGIVVLDFGIHWQNAAAIVSAALATQWVGSKFAGLSGFDPLSALITSLSLTMLFRTDLVALAALAAFVSIGSKFLIRFRDKHVFNPANFAIVTLILLSDHAWISTGQWGNAAIGALALAGLGFLVLTRAKRGETTLSFLLAFAALLFGRALWLGDPLSIPMHQLSNGALLIFAFFMISDPKTTPDARFGRILFGVVVALVAMFIRFVLFEPAAPVLALIVCSPLVPLIDSAFRGELYRWQAPAGEPLLSRSPKCDY